MHVITWSPRPTCTLSSFLAVLVGREGCLIPAHTAIHSAEILRSPTHFAARPRAPGIRRRAPLPLPCLRGARPREIGRRLRRNVARSACCIQLLDGSALRLVGVTAPWLLVGARLRSETRPALADGMAAILGQLTNGCLQEPQAPPPDWASHPGLRCTASATVESSFC
jgi:hypothetical protein